jgi:diguanylate cyclase (GGDEF)-like protein
MALSQSARLERARDQARRDALTGLYSHHHFIDLVRAEIECSSTSRSSFAVIMLDVDGRHGLKEINDLYGHEAGDRLVAHLARTLTQQVRPRDVVARYGGDEFLVLAPDTDIVQARVLAQRLVDALHTSELNVTESVSLQVTLSAGGAIYSPGRPEDAEALMDRLDKALYTAKESSESRFHVDWGA